MPRHALIAGVSGIIGRHLAEHLLATKGWSVTGLSRHKHDLPKGVKHIAVDLTNDEAVVAALKKVNPTDVFITTWLRQPTEAENCRVNAGMVRNLQSAMEGKKITTSLTSTYSRVKSSSRPDRLCETSLQNVRNGAARRAGIRERTLKFRENHSILSS